MKFVLFFVLFGSINLIAQDPIVYNLEWHEEYNGGKVHHLISLSDQYRLSDHEDSSAVPTDIIRPEEGPAPNSFKLKGIYRKRCLNALNISENDVVYVYDYAQDKLLRFYVRGLELAAVLSHYSSVDYQYLSQRDYRIGFKINPKYLTGFKPYYTHVLVAIGKTNPFTRGKMEAIKWKKIDNNKFPTETTLMNEIKYVEKCIPMETYQFELDDMTIYLQNIGLNGNLNGRHIAIVKSNEIITEFYFRGSEGGSPSPLNGIHPDYGPYVYQFAGQLFKDNPPMILGFMSHSFGCSGIHSIEKESHSIYINCDNRH
ncbi:hypothetical protein [Crocinitomix catalasitica]|uniref:hypothetical protein n=1 Tax=Crocinitomix catalasitica TaxID=184607 RepID=UPI0004898160|nr:hypothetical protein [Crocinitomix catalasitica]